MVPRKQLDIAWSDLAAGLAAVFARNPVPVSGDIPFAGETAIQCLSARSGLDLLCSGLDLPPGSEILVSALTIPDIPRILRAHGLVPVPVDLDFSTAAVDPVRLREAITPKSRALIVAHLFGGYGEMTAVLAIAREAGLFLIEDCAQAFRGASFTGDPASDAVLFSFGPIKTATATGGGVLFVKDSVLREKLRARHREWERQPRSEHLRRLLRFTLFKFLLLPPVYGILNALIRWSGRDQDAVVGEAARSFRKGDFFARIRRQPCVPLCRLMLRRIRNYPSSRLRERAACAATLLEAVPPGVVPGLAAPAHSHWVLPVTVANPAAWRARLLAAGFDATRAASSMAPVPSGDDRPGVGTAVACGIHREILYLPCDPGMTAPQRERLRLLLREGFADTAARR